MTKSEAIKRAKTEHPKSEFNSRNTHFANIHSSKNVWWYDVPLEKVNSSQYEHLNLLAFDDKKDKLYYLHIPVAYFQENRVNLRKRGDKNVVSLELSASTLNLFQDIAPKSNRISFQQFLVQ